MTADAARWVANEFGGEAFLHRRVGGAVDVHINAQVVRGAGD